MGNEVDFLQANKDEFFLQLIVSFWVCVAMHAQSAQNSKFTISLQYRRKEVTGEVDFLHADKHKSFL